MTLDKSPKGSIDSRCIPIMEVLNVKGSGYTTTSSCSGRISIFSDKSGWIFVSHDPLEPEDIEDSDLLLSKLFPGHKVILQESVDEAINDSQPMVYFKFEPFILHVKADSIFPLGYDLFSKAYNLGYRNSGLTISKKNPNSCTVAVRSTLKIDAPIGYLDESSMSISLIVSPSYLKLLCKMANQKFQSNFNKMSQFLSSIKP